MKMVNEIGISDTGNYSRISYFHILTCMPLYPFSFVKTEAHIVFRSTDLREAQREFQPQNSNDLATTFEEMELLG